MQPQARLCARFGGGCDKYTVPLLFGGGGSHKFLVEAKLQTNE